MLDEASAVRLEPLKDELVSVGPNLVGVLDGVVTEILWSVPEAGVNAHGLIHHLKVVALLDQLCDVSRLVDGGIRNVSETVQTMLSHGEPQLDSIGSSTAGKCLVANVVLGILGLMEQVTGSGGVGGSQGVLLVISNQHAALSWHAETLVRVECNRVTSLHAIEYLSLPIFVSKDEEAAPTGIDVVPHAVFLADIRNSVVVVKTTHHSGASYRVDEERLVAFLNLFLNGLLESYWVHRACLSITANLDHLVHAHSTDHGASVDAVVTLSSSEGHWSIVSFPAFHSNVREVLVASSEESHHVGHRTTWVESAVNLVLIETKLLAKDSNRLHFHHREDRRNVVNMHISIQHSNDEFCNLADWVRTGVQLVHEEGMESLETVLEARHDVSNAFFVGSSSVQDWTQFVYDLLRHDEATNESAFGPPTLLVVV